MLALLHSRQQKEIFKPTGGIFISNQLLRAFQCFSQRHKNKYFTESRHNLTCRGFQHVHEFSISQWCHDAYSKGNKQRFTVEESHKVRASSISLGHFWTLTVNKEGIWKRREQGRRHVHFGLTEPTHAATVCRRSNATPGFTLPECWNAKHNFQTRTRPHSLHAHLNTQTCKTNWHPQPTFSPQCLRIRTPVFLFSSR